MSETLQVTFYLPSIRDFPFHSTNTSEDISWTFSKPTVMTRTKYYLLFQRNYYEHKLHIAKRKVITRGTDINTDIEIRQCLFYFTDYLFSRLK